MAVAVRWAAHYLAGNPFESIVTRARPFQLITIPHRGALCVRERTMRDVSGRRSFKPWYAQRAGELTAGSTMVAHPALALAIGVAVAVRVARHRAARLCRLRGQQNCHQLQKQGEHAP